MQGSVVQVNISNGGVPKYPVLQAHLTPHGVEGDRHNNTQIHGGPRQAVLLIAAEVVDELKEQGFSVFYGALGENITMVGIDRRQLRAGQRFRIGEAIVELTKLRSPCATLNPYGSGIQKAVYDGKTDPSVPQWGKSGFYAAVIVAGWVRPGDPIQLLEQVA